MLTGLARSTIYLWAKVGKFPNQVSIGGGRCVGWRAMEILRWLESCCGRELSEVGCTRGNLVK